MAEEDNPAGFCDAHGTQLRMKQAIGRRELTCGFARSAGAAPLAALAVDDLLDALEEVGDGGVSGGRVGVRRVQ